VEDTKQIDGEFFQIAYCLDIFQG